MTQVHTVHHMLRIVGVAAIGLTLVPTPGLAQRRAVASPEVKVSRLAAGRALVEVAGPDVTIRKEVSTEASHLTITTKTDELHIRIARNVLTLSTPNGTVTVTDARPEEMARLMALLQRSDAALRGRELLKQVPDAPRQFGHHTLLLTRAVLELATGPSPALTIHRQWVQDERAARDKRALGGVMKVGLQSGGSDRGPGDCWDIYSKEAIRIANDFVQCTDGLKWYDALGWSGCSLVYTIRAEAAMFWFVNCSGGFPFSG